VVGRAEDLADGEQMIVTVNNRSIGIFNIRGRYFGLLNSCPHRGAELCKGRLFAGISSDGPGEYEYDEGERLLMCPWHGWEFDVTTGQSYCSPTTVRARPIQVDVEDGQAVIAEVEAGEASYTPCEFAQVARDAVPDANGRIPGPYRAETVEIAVEGDYLVVDLRPRRPPRPVTRTAGDNAGAAVRTLQTMRAEENPA
jgi:3-phenylpropionate/trans-cinnamate dioxygenase ferredoxin subunit